jgi:hypothetical protein
MNTFWQTGIVIFIGLLTLVYICRKIYFLFIKTKKTETPSPFCDHCTADCELARKAPKGKS